MDSETRRDERSTDITFASILSPTAKRSGRWSARSRDRSERRMKDFIAGEPNSISIPPEVISVTVQVTIVPRFTPEPPSAGASIGSPDSCLMPSEMRSLSTSTSRTFALTMSPLLKASMACSPDLSQAMSLMCTIPSRSGPRPTNRPNSVMPRTSPSISVPIGCSARNAVHGLSMVCFRPSEMRRFSESTSRTSTSTS